MVVVTMLADCGLAKRRIFNRDDDCRNWNLLLNGYRGAVAFEIETEMLGDGGGHEVVDDYDMVSLISLPFLAIEEDAARAYGKAAIECNKREVSYEGNILPTTHLDKSEEAGKLDDSKEVTFKMWRRLKLREALKNFNMFLRMMVVN
ncbi:hypothetical protein L1987_37089 [Smallanthus sonchifolius]|uniref:Uncharacterized protein n=1 Tax=Smallanthus sonchifolius TaxID=185202 RepID=A0ACB9HHX8_9ASTR|nr:hypothetical protein L1987_37089 [Smallanthus sonchifolius]